MDMSDFWSTITEADELSYAQVRRLYPGALEAAKEDDILPAYFAFSVIPNLGPSGPTCDADEAELDAEDPDEEIMDATGPSLSGEKALMAYRTDADELYCWQDGEWICWNY